MYDEGSGEEYSLFKERTYIRFHYQMSFNMIPGRQVPRRHSGFEAWSFQKWFTSCVDENYRSLPQLFLRFSPSSAPSKQEEKGIKSTCKLKMEF